jgi:hypothetical protein
MMVGVEDPDELAGHARERGVHVLGLRHASLDPERQEARVVVGDLLEDLLDRQRLRSVVGEDHLQVRIVLLQERLHRLDDGPALVRQVGRDDGRRPRQPAVRQRRRLSPAKGGAALDHDRERGQREGEDEDDESDTGDVQPQPVHRHVGEERQPEAEQLLEADLERSPQPGDVPPQARALARRLLELGAPAHRMEV